MILSMTGFASASAQMPGISLAVELRSVNHRYLDVTIKVPDELRTLETSLRERLATAQKRGKVECRVALLRTVGAAGGLAITVALVQHALSELTSARAREGAKLRAVLEARCTDIEGQLARVTPRIPALHAAYMEKL